MLHTIFLVRSLWMTVHTIRNTMSCPSCVSYTTVGQKLTVKVQIHSYFIKRDVRFLAQLERLRFQYHKNNWGPCDFGDPLFKNSGFL